ncbi:PP2C family serine/threonine-protein phosphatase [Domibacillus epiphyticus]|uniref:Phosphoserine phosphatase n=1 Tax=Domibacillus epiphyticus TaxID=1714355 RepID=A0A1V2A786_9BACI|nr:PP2C family serine/threonine-protein phosphatase [Domibacillus epiphyticus]OMP66807.1 phosphoserine phosphatase [Domibacillus epiphyticus]
MDRLKNTFIEMIAGSRSKNNNSFCGDTYFVELNNGEFICLLADGLGSGRYAYESSFAAAEAVKQRWQSETVEELMESVNQSLHQKRGAAVAIFKVNFEARQFEYTCVGNIRFYLYAPDGKLTYPLPVTGYLSGRPQRYRMERFTYEKGSKFLVHSDGVNLLNTKELMRFRTAEQIAAELDGAAVSANDDATYIVGSLL